MGNNEYSEMDDELVDVLNGMGLDENLIIPIVVICSNDGVTGKMLDFIKENKNVNKKMIVEKLTEMASDKYKVKNNINRIRIMLNVAPGMVYRSTYLEELERIYGSEA